MEWNNIIHLPSSIRHHPSSIRHQTSYASAPLETTSSLQLSYKLFDDAGLLVLLYIVYYPMNIIKTNIDGVVALEPLVHKDTRGYLFEAFSQREFDEQVQKVQFVYENEYKRPLGFVTGLHFQKPPYSQNQLVRCVSGRIRFIALDIRRGSSTYGQYVSVELSDESHHMLFIPQGFAVGYVVLSEHAVIQCKYDKEFSAESVCGINITDKALGIDFGLYSNGFLQSEEDAHYPSFEDLHTPFIKS